MDAIKNGLGQWLGRWFTQIAPMTPALQEYVKRPLAKAIAMAPGRMIDEAQSMLELWHRNDTNRGPTTPAMLPMCLVAMARDMTPTGRERDISLSTPVNVVIPGDGRERVFELRTLAREYRVQLVFAANDPNSAAALAEQFVLWIERPMHQVFEAPWTFAGITVPWPVQLQTSDTLAMNIATGTKNLTLLALDITLCATEPIYRAPGANEGYIDGSGDIGTNGPGSGTGMEGNGPGDHNPDGFPVLRQINIDHHEEGWRGGSAHIASHEVDKDGIRSVEPPPHE